jgi:hypothetical protein
MIGLTGLGILRAIIAEDLGADPLNKNGFSKLKQSKKNFQKCRKQKRLENLSH